MKSVIAARQIIGLRRVWNGHMNVKRILSRIFLSTIGLLLCALLALGWMKYNEGGPVPYPLGLGSLVTIEYTTVDPTTILEDIRSGKEPILQVQSGYPEDLPFITSIRWSQNDYLEIAEAFHVAIWKDDPNEWHLYKAFFRVDCENIGGGFEIAALYYYQEVIRDEKRVYSVRIIMIVPQFGYIAWGGDTFYPRPIGGWEAINLESITSIPAEKALELAEQQGGNDFRSRAYNACYIYVTMWPWGYKRIDWWVNYSGKTDFEVWIPSR